MPSWNEAATTPDLADVLAEAIRTNTFKVTGPERHDKPAPSKVERITSRTPREYLDRFLADGMPLALAVEMTQRWLAGGSDPEVVGVRTLTAQAAWDTRTDYGKFAGFYRGAPRVHQSVSCGRTVPGASPVAGTASKRRAHALAEEWRAMRR